MLYVCLMQGIWLFYSSMNNQIPVENHMVPRVMFVMFPSGDLMKRSAQWDAPRMHDSQLGMYGYNSH